MLLQECKRLVLRLCGSKRGAAINLLAIAFVAWGLPWFLGLQFLRAVVLIPLASLSAFLVADSVLETRPAQATPAAFAARLTACVLVGWSCGLFIVLAGVLATNLQFWSGEPLLPPAMILIDAALFSLSASILAAGVAITLFRKVSSPSLARLVLKLSMLTVVLSLLYGCNKAESEGLLLPTDGRITQLTWIASIFFLANGAALIWMAANDPRFRHRKTPADSA